MMRSLIVVAIFAMCIAHPGFVFKDRREEAEYTGVASTPENKVFLDKQQRVEYHGSGYEESRV